MITTDAAGAITYLNPTAERLTGWSETDARGQPVSAVFVLFDEHTRAPVADPVHRCLREGRSVGTDGPAVLVGRTGEEHAVGASAAPNRDRTGVLIGAVLAFHDVTNLRRLAKRMKYEATHDALTGLVNRREFDRRLQRAVNTARAQGHEHALCYFDLDRFKLVNDIAGHAAGDSLLQQVGRLLADKFRERDTLARLGGDEFALLLENCAPEEAHRIAGVTVASFREWRFVWMDRAFRVGASAGLTSITRATESAQQAMSEADAACYSAKENGRDRVHEYCGDGAPAVPQHAPMIVASSLVDALTENRFRLVGQPIVALGANGTYVHRTEVLLRLADESGADVPTATLIQAAERYGIMASIDRWVIDNALRTHASVQNPARASNLSINLSGDSLGGDLAAFVSRSFDRHRTCPEQVCFEITETAAARNLDQALRFLHDVKKLGCLVALDDFGGGLPSFRYLRDLPIDYLKIDGSFIRDLGKSAEDDVVVRSMNDLAHALGVITIAEGVADQPTAECLRNLGVDCAQGYAFGAPAPLAEMLASPDGGHLQGVGTARSRSGACAPTASSSGSKAPCSTSSSGEDA
ncbi:MAG: EAL domain-containing protein [Rhodospirillales bacterium]|nr:EAL domain-containing protein [Rhodospirillales bacterium]